VLEWEPFELRPNAPDTGWPIPEYVRARMGAPDNPLRLRAKQLGIELIERVWIPSSRRAHECTEFARAAGKLEAFHAAVLRAYWSEGRDLHDWSVLEAAAVAAGLDPAAMRAGVDAGTFRDAVTERIAAAHELGIHAVPTFVIANRVTIQGAQTLEVFERAIERAGRGDE
jgi:predicted DsbA family dithiol-disulfide isomerase